MLFQKIILSFCFLFSMASYASDHVDGVPLLERHEQVDLSDLYVFKTSKDKLAVVLNIYPGVADDGHFSSKVSYEIIVKQMVSDLEKKQFKTKTAEEIVILCSFEDTEHHVFTGSDGTKGKTNCFIKNEYGEKFEIEFPVGRAQFIKKKTINKAYAGA